MLQLDETFLVVIDVQGKLASLMHERDALLDGCRRMVQCAQALDIPVIWTEQIPEKMGPTVPELAELIDGAPVMPKTAFSCCGDRDFVSAITAANRHQALLIGIEAHVCVYQTAIDLIGRDVDVEVVADAVSSRTPENRQIGLDRMRRAGARIASVEMAVFEIMRDATHPAFRNVLTIVK